MHCASLWGRKVVRLTPIFNHFYCTMHYALFRHSLIVLLIVPVFFGLLITWKRPTWSAKLVKLSRPLFMFMMVIVSTLGLYTNRFCTSVIYCTTFNRFCTKTGSSSAWSPGMIWCPPRVSDSQDILSAWSFQQFYVWTENRSSHCLSRLPFRLRQITLTHKICFGVFLKIKFLF